MNRIRIQNFGPIRDSGWIDIKKVTVFLGNQGSGKSTIAKLIATFLWMEKVLYRGDYPERWFERSGRFRSQLLTYHRLENYIVKNLGHESSIEYEGGNKHISYQGGHLSLCTPSSLATYQLPQILYIPAERNFIAYVRTPKELKLSSKSLGTFVGEFSVARDAMKGDVRLPINDSFLEYDRLNDTMKLRGRDYKISLSDAASGFQSCAPLYLTTQHFATSVTRQEGVSDPEMSSDEKRRFQKEVAELYSNEELSDEQRKAAISALSKRFKKSAFINIVEEPEQNLFPKSQWQLFYSLLGFNNMQSGNKLMTTTHSPYLIGALTLAIQGAELKTKIESQTNEERCGELLNRLAQVVPLEALVDATDVAVYQLDETTGTASSLPMTNGVPSDENVLNTLLGRENDDFDALLAIEEELG